LKCTATAGAKLSKNVVDISLGRTGTLTYVDSKDDASLPPGFLQLRYQGEVTLSGSIGLKAEASFNGNVTCEFKKSFVIPVAGFLSIIGSPAIPVGLGVSFDGKLVAASLELTLNGKIGVTFDLGVTCGPDGAACASFRNVEPINEMKPKVEVPNADQMRLKLDGSMYLLSGLDFALFGGLATYSIAEFKIGPTQSANLAFVDSQGNERDYASSYELNIGYSLGLGSDVKKLISYLGSGLVSVDAKLEDKLVLAKSATGTFAVDKPKIAANQKAMFTTTLTRDLDYWKLGYNVESVKLYRKKESSTTYDLMATIEASPGQSKFEWQFRPTEADYDGAMSTGAFTVTQVMTCPGDPPQVVVIPSWDIPLFMVNVDQGFDAGPDGKTLRGSYGESSETHDETWEWDLTLD
jgi:hypothetical protein